MDSLDKKIIIKGALKYFLVSCITSGLLFITSGSLYWPGAWVISGFSILYIVLILSVGIKFFPETIIARSKSKLVNGWDKRAILIYSVSYVSQYTIASLDFRYYWSTFRPIFFILGVFLYSCGMAITFWVLASNPYAIGSSRIQKDRNQKVVSHGPYRVVRHPMYFTTILFALSTPFILESVWALIPSPFIIGSFVYRCYKEDTMLQHELAGYTEYCKKVKYRMIPFLW